MATTAPPRTTATDHRLGFESLTDEVELDSVPVTGALPEWLTGSLLRTGPAAFEVGERSLNHWFDGLAMLHRFGFGDGRVGYSNRFLHGRSYAAARERGRLEYSEFATDPCRSLFKRMTTLFSPVSGLTDNCNVNVARLGEEFIAMTETPMPLVFDSDTLETAGLAYEPPGEITTAHPHHDPERDELINYAVHLGPRSEYRFFAQRGRTEQRAIATLRTDRPAYVHSFGLSERYLVLAEFPFRVNPLKLAVSGRPYIENYEWDPQRGTRFHVFDRAAGALRGSYRAEPRFGFHHVNCFEDDGKLVADVVVFDDPKIIGALYLRELRKGGELPRSRLRRYRIDLAGGAVDEEEPVPDSFELPRIDYSRNGRPYRYAYGAGVGDGAPWLDRIVKVDLAERATAVWSEEGCWPGEPVFVAEPRTEAEDAGVLLSVVLDSRRGGSFLLVLDAADLSELARAEVPHHIPHNFHGQYSARA